MKLKFKILIYFIIAVGYNCVAQIVNIEDKDGTRINGTYYKDTNNLLDPFEGTYVYTNGNTSIKLVLKKKSGSSMNGFYTEDLLIGEYQYIKNGVEKKNTLNKLAINYPNGIKHSISGNSIINNDSYECSDCYPGEIRIKCSLFEETVQSSAIVLISRLTYMGQPAIKLEMWWTKKTRHVDAPPSPPNPSIPGGEYILIKQ